jgi:kynurenine formamidase
MKDHDSPGADPDRDALASKWGPADELGAANLLPHVLTPEVRAVIGEGRIFDLSQPICVESPRLPMLMSPYSICMWSNPISSRHFLEETYAIENAIGYADERVEFDLHTGTHIDALGHTFTNDRTYNGFTVREVVTNWGLKRLGIENLPPVVARGVLIDVPALRGRDLEPGEVVAASDLERALSRQDVVIERGDVVLIRTGWARYYTDPETYVAGWPGIGLDAATWLVEHDVSIVGADTMGVEVYPDEVATVHAPVHQYLLARSGVYILEQANLDPIADADVYVFLCLCLVPRFVGGTAAPVRLVALA